MNCQVESECVKNRFVSARLLTGVWLEEIVAGGELEGHAGGGPDVGGGAVARSQQHLQRSEAQKNIILLTSFVDTAGSVCHSSPGFKSSNFQTGQNDDQMSAGGL